MKTAIIGAGVNGLYLARELVKKGNDATVFEQRNTVGKECCSGLFSTRLFDYFPAAKALVENEISDCLIHFPKKEIRLSFRNRFYVIDHAALDRAAAGEAERAGAHLKFGERIEATRLALLQSQFDRTIGCDGALSATRRFLGLKNPSFWLGIQGIEQKKDSSNTVETWATKHGFLWRIPRTKDVEWGIMERAETAKTLFDAFIAQNKVELAQIKSAIIPQGLVLPNNGKITLCGDATGLTKPWSGGGVVWGLKQADVLLKNFPNFVQYKKEAERMFLPQIMFSSLAKHIVYLAGFLFPRVLPGKAAIDGDFILKF